MEQDIYEKHTKENMLPHHLFFPVYLFEKKKHIHGCSFIWLWPCMKMSIILLYIFFRQQFNIHEYPSKIL